MHYHLKHNAFVGKKKMCPFKKCPLPVLLFLYYVLSFVSLKIHLCLCTHNTLCMCSCKYINAFTLTDYGK